MGKNNEAFEVVPFPRIRLPVTDVMRMAHRKHTIDGQIEEREFLNLTVSFEHEIVDGGPAARFAQRFTELLESGYGIKE
jgi:pyruvate/2-oxoglutarate dehydrogenase complex dihydrolipoamide acyltransferase (E2) component